MALIKCKECKTEISSEAKSCPKCGSPIAKKSIGCGSLVGIAFVGFIILQIISGIFSPNTENSVSNNKTSAPLTPTEINVKVEPPAIGSQWKYHQHNDEMSKGMIYQAFVSSTNTVNFNFPYSGDQYGRLILRNHPRFGKDIIFKIEQGQILCRSYENCTVLVRFDDEASVNYSAIGPSDNSSDTIFINNYNKFINRMSKANTLKIAVNIYKEGAPTFEFDVSGFDQEKYIPKSTPKAAPIPSAKPKNFSI